MSDLIVSSIAIDEDAAAAAGDAVMLSCSPIIQLMLLYLMLYPMLYLYLMLYPMQRATAEITESATNLLNP